METLIWMFLVLPVVMTLLALLAASLIWVYQDAEARNKPGILVVLLVLLFNWPIGLLLWLVFRPQYETRTT